MTASIAHYIQDEPHDAEDDRNNGDEPDELIELSTQISWSESRPITTSRAERAEITDEFADFVQHAVETLSNKGSSFETIEFFLEPESAYKQTTIAKLRSFISDSFDMQPETSLQASATDIFAQGAQRMSQYLDEEIGNQRLNKLKKTIKEDISALQTARSAQDLH